MAVRKPAATKRRKRRTAAAKNSTTSTRRKSTRGKKRATAAKTAGRGKRKTAAKKTASKAKKSKVGATRKKKTIRRKTKVGATRKKKTATRKLAKKGAAVKKKPGKSKIQKKTSKTPSNKINRKLRNVKKKANTVPESTKAISVTVKKKQRQAKSDSQALPIAEQQPTQEIKMATPKKLKKRIQKKDPLLEETRPELVKETDFNIAPYKERPGEDYMSADQQSHFKRLLLQRKRMLLEDMGRTVHHLQDEASSLPDISDRATQEEEFNLELRARDRERKLIKKIEDALHKLDEGHYGFCDSCGVEIGIRRLEARPTATLCIDCKTLDEIREKQMGG